MVLLGCGGASDRCQTRSPCSADPMRTTGDIRACQDAEKNPGKCGKEKAAFDDCFLVKAVCGSDGKTDPLQTFSACMNESDAFQKCSSM
jgi:hypothetical protein